MTFGQLEHEIRRIPGVVAAQVATTDVVVLVSPDADPAVVRAAIDGVLRAFAATAAVTVLGGASPAAAAGRRRTVGVVATAAGAALLTAAGIAGAVSGAFHLATPERPRVGGAAAPGAPVPPREPNVGTVVPERERRVPPAAPVAPAPAPAPEPVELAAAAASPASEPVLLVIPLPGTPAARHTAAVPSVTAPAPPPPPPAPAPAPAVEPALPPAVEPVRHVDARHPTETAGDEHDADRGERAGDSNGHDRKGPQGHGRPGNGRGHGRGRG